MLSPRMSSRRQHLMMIQLCLLLLPKLASVLVLSFSYETKSLLRLRPTTMTSSMLLPLRGSASRGNFNTQPRERNMVSSKLFSTPNDDDDNFDEEESRLDSRSTIGRGMYTEGGVIMPEGGANPCVIKVRERTNNMTLL